MCQRLRDARLLRSATGALILAGFFLAMLMTVSPDLHQSVHHDAHDAQHSCLATLLNNGGCEGAPVILFAAQPLPDPILILPVLEVAPAASFFLTCSIFEHGPPVVS